MPTPAEELAQLQTEEAGLLEQIAAARGKVRDAVFQQIVGDVAPVTTTTRSRRVLKGHQEKIYSIAWSKAGDRFLSAGQDGKLLIWDPRLSSKNKMSVGIVESRWVMACALSPSGQRAACGGLDNIVSVFDMQDIEGKLMKELRGHEGYIAGIRFVSEDTLISGSGDQTAALWDIKTGTKTTEFIGHDDNLNSIDVTDDGRMLVTGGCDKMAKIWDVRSGKCVQTHRLHEKDINAVRWFPDMKAFGTACDDGSCKIVDTRCDNELQTYHHPEIRLGSNDIAFSISGRLLFVANDINIMVWDILTGQNTQILTSHDERVTSLGVSPDGLALASGSWDKTVRIWLA